MTQDEIVVTNALHWCSMLPGSSDKRFARAMRDIAEHNQAIKLTPRQHANLMRIGWRYRRQIGAGALEIVSLIRSRVAAKRLAIPIGDKGALPRERMNVIEQTESDAHMSKLLADRTRKLPPVPQAVINAAATGTPVSISPEEAGYIVISPQLDLDFAP